MLFAIRCLHGENVREQSMRALGLSLLVTGVLALALFCINGKVRERARRNHQFRPSVDGVTDMLKPTILLDKNYLQGSKALDIQRLAESHQLMMVDVLFYELISSAEPGRSRCFAKLPKTENPVMLVKHLGALLKLEIESHQACGKPSLHYEDIRFQLNA